MPKQTDAGREVLELAAKETAARNERLTVIRNYIEDELQELWKSWMTPKKEKKVAKLSGADSLISDVIVEGEKDLVKIHKELGGGER